MREHNSVWRRDNSPQILSSPKTPVINVTTHGKKDLTHMVKLVTLQQDLCKREVDVMGQRGAVTREV